MTDDILPAEVLDEELMEIDRALKEQAVTMRNERNEMVRKCSHRYRAALSWASIHNEEELDALIQQVETQMASGDFWLGRIGLVAQTDPVLVMALMAIRQRWLEEFDVASVSERLLVDQAMIALYHQLRLHEFIGNVQGRVEHDFFGVEPLLAVNRSSLAGVPQYQVDDHLRRIDERLLTAITRCHRMIASSLRLLVRMKGMRQLTIHNEGQVNLAQQQVNVITAPAKGDETK